MLCKSPMPESTMIPHVLTLSIPRNAAPAAAPVARSAADEDDEQLDADGYELDTRKVNDDDDEQLDADGYELDTRKVNDDDDEQLDAEGYELDTRKTKDADEEKEEEEEIAAGEEDA